jgi:hypothetical protein
MTNKQVATQNDSEHDKQHEFSKDNHVKEARHRRRRKQEADYGEDERLRGSALEPEIRTSEDNDGSKRDRGYVMVC